MKKKSPEEGRKEDGEKNVCTAHPRGPGLQQGARQESVAAHHGTCFDK